MIRKKILFIARWYPDKNDNMLGLFIQKHARAVHEIHDVTVIYVTADNSIELEKTLIDEQNHFGINEIRIYFRKSRFELINAFKYAYYYLKAVRIAEKKSGVFNLVHVHVLSRTAFPAILLKFTKGIPYIITEHWSRYLPVNLQNGSYSGILRKGFTRVAVTLASAVTTVTSNLASAMQKLHLKNRYYITPNIADIHDFHPLENKKENSIKKLLHVSCFDEPAKNIMGIINVIERLSKLRNDFVLEIVGDGKDFQMVKNHATQTGLLGKNIFFTGLLTGNELSSKMREADAFVMFSNYENLPCTIVESLSSGVPVISTNVGGIAEHISSKFGLLINPRNESELLNAIQKSLDFPETFDRQAMRAYALKHFSMEESGKLFHEIYLKSGMK
ncbi:MAG TPA: glycosyltransferase [Bacteroidia bacterium]|nr:glycosyltransferase [Bacteroidia bacterium]